MKRPEKGVNFYLNFYYFLFRGNFCLPFLNVEEEYPFCFRPVINKLIDL